MMKLCWLGEIDVSVFHYFLDLSDYKVYRANLDKYNKTQLEFTPTTAALVVGPVVAIMSVLFRNKNLVFDKVQIILMVISLLFLAVSVSIFYDRSQKKQKAFIIKNSIGEEKTKKDILAFYNAGKKQRLGIMFFIAFSFVFMILGIYINRVEKTFFGIIILYLAAFSTIIWIKVLSPVKLIKTILYLNKEDI
ncbi:MAG: hypothetical protein GXZ13_07495 [Synergistaceae bacterium]|nr:hypothetical protein [Synergistaceae bacterium]